MTTRGFTLMARRPGVANVFSSLALALCISAAPIAAQAAPGGVSEGLQVWLRAGAGVSVADGENVLVWADSSGNANDAVWNPGNAHGEQPPIFDALNPGANDKATVRFNNENALELDLTWLAGSDYTIFVVNARDRDGLANFYIGGDTALLDSNLVLGYEQPSLLRQAHFNRDLDGTVPNYEGSPVWALDAFRFAQADGKDIYQNGELLNTDDEITPLASNSGSTLGHFRAFGDLYWFQGDLAEVVVYDRALSEFERTQVEMALAVRYALPVELTEYVPCNSEWRNHGQYVSALARLIEMLVDEGVLTEEEGEAVVAEGAQSGCGR